jgi:hypothetical protein
VTPPGRRATEACAALVAAFCAPASADDDAMLRVLPCRPTISCSADLVPPGALEIEAGYATRHVRDDGFVHTEPLLLKLTLLRWLQAQAGTNGLVFTTGRVRRPLYYVDDITLGAKIHVFDQTPDSPSFAVSASINVPSFYRNDAFPYAYDASFWGYLSKDLGVPGEPGSLHVDLNGGLNVWEFDIPQKTFQEFGAAALTLGLPCHLSLMGEIYGFTDGGRIAPEDAGVLAALGYAPIPSMMFDAGGDISLVPSTRQYTLFAGVTFVPFRLWEE